MRFGLLLALLLVLCAAVVLSQESSPAGERPPTADSSSVDTDVPEKPNSSSDNPEKPTESSSSENGGSMCTMIAYQCPDGTIATQNAECQFICGAPPTGNLSWTYVDNVRLNFQKAYNVIGLFVGDMELKDIVLRPPEKKSDLCLEATISLTDTSFFPDVYKSVRVFYTKVSDIPSCSPRVCPDGSMVGCDDVCPEEPETSPLFMPFVLVFGVVLLSACCCCIRRRRCKAQCQQAQPVGASPTHDAYPAEYYALLQQEQALAAELSEIPPQMPPHMMAHPMIFPPMPPIPPHMMQNDAFPVMIQAPNGVWYMAPPHPEDA